MTASVLSNNDAIDAAFCNTEPDDLGRIDHAGLDKVFVLLGLRG